MSDTLQSPTIQFVKLHPDAKLPRFNIQDELTGDIGADVFSVESKVVPARGSAVVDIGLQVGFIQPGYYFVISPRSGLGFKHGIQPHLGRIDNQYRGNLSVKLYNFSDADHTVSVGDRIAQLEFHKLIQPSLEWADQATTTDRGANGFGSSGK
jgi:dUTP pyrophosphatase